MSEPAFLPPRSTDVGPTASELRVHLDFPRGRLALVGTLGRGTSYRLRDAIGAILVSGRDSWSADVSGLTLADRTGVRALGEAYRRLVRHGRRLTIVGAAPPLTDLLARVRLDLHVVTTDAPPPEEERCVQPLNLRRSNSPPEVTAYSSPASSSPNEVTCGSEPIRASAPAR